MSVLRRLRRVAGPESAQEVAEAPGDVPTATGAVWCAAWPGGRSYHDDDDEAERVAGEMVKPRRVEVACVYRVSVESEGAA